MGNLKRTLKNMAGATGIFGAEAQTAAAFDYVRRNEAAMLAIPASSAILAAHPIPPAQIAAERNDLRGTSAKARAQHKVGVVFGVLLAILLLCGLIITVIDAVREGEVGWLLVKALALVAIVAIPVTVARLRARKHEPLDEIRRHLGIADSPDGRDTILDWLDCHWPWPCPPKLFAGWYWHLQGVRRGHPFLILAEQENNDDSLRTGMQRTCVFFAGPAGPHRRLDLEGALPFDLPVHVTVTPAGLFACWALATLEGLTGEQWARILDRLLALAGAGDDGRILPESTTAPLAQQAG